MATFSVTYGGDGFTIAATGGSGDTVSQFTLFTVGDKPVLVAAAYERYTSFTGIGGGTTSAVLYGTTQPGGSLTDQLDANAPATNGGQPMDLVDSIIFHAAPGTDVKFQISQTGTFDSTYSFKFTVKVI